MTRGIYIMANDRVLEHAKALLNSIRVFDKETPVLLIPYDDNYKAAQAVLGAAYGVALYPDLKIVERLAQKIGDAFPPGFIPRPNQFRKQACWFGPFEEFLYIDTDVVVFEKIINTLDLLNGHDFLCCDYQFKGGIKNVFTDRAIESGLIQVEDIRHIFNAGFWGGRKNAVTEDQILSSARECAARLECFDFSQKTSDMPIFNYSMIKNIKNKVNLTQIGSEPGSWAGTKHFLNNDNILSDPNSKKNLRYLHWAGINIKAGCPYWEIWEYYRNLK